MKFHLTPLRNAIPFALLILTFISCQKSSMQETITEESPKNKKACECIEELALPDIKGELVTFGEGDNKISVEKKGDQYVLGGDIILSKEQVKILQGAQNGRTALVNFVSHWYRGKVPYIINSGVGNQQRITDAINHWQNNTSLQFVPRTNEPNYIEFVTASANDCSSPVGRIGGRQVINIGANCTGGNMIHEIGHAIGFLHEHTRLDRDDFIIVREENIRQDRLSQFELYTIAGYAGFEFGALDIWSVMMYGSDFFSSNGQPTITLLNGGLIFAQRNGLSAGDIETATLMYGPPYVRIRYETTNYSGPDDSYIVADVFADFFSDQACTVPFNLTSARTIPIEVEQQTYQGGGWGSSRYTYNAQVPQGVNTIRLEENATLEYILYDYGNIMGGSRQSFTCPTGFAR